MFYIGEKHREFVTTCCTKYCSFIQRFESWGTSQHATRQKIVAILHTLTPAKRMYENMKWYDMECFIWKAIQIKDNLSFSMQYLMFMGSRAHSTLTKPALHIQCSVLKHKKSSMYCTLQELWYLLTLHIKANQYGNAWHCHGLVLLMFQDAVKVLLPPPLQNLVICNDSNLLDLPWNGVTTDKLINISLRTKKKRWPWTGFLWLLPADFFLGSPNSPSTEKIAVPSP